MSKNLHECPHGLYGEEDMTKMKQHFFNKVSVNSGDHTTVLDSNSTEYETIFGTPQFNLGEITMALLSMKDPSKNGSKTRGSFSMSCGFGMQCFYRQGFYHR